MQSQRIRYQKKYTDPRNPNYESIYELQPILNKISTANPYKLMHLSCTICLQFAINPRQCPVCDFLTCAHCSNSDFDDPHLCKNCLRNEVLNGVLDKPNKLKATTAHLRNEVVTFDCPFRCGTIDMAFEALQDHAFKTCRLKPLESMEDVRLRP